MFTAIGIMLFIALGLEVVLVATLLMYMISRGLHGQ